MYNVVSPLRGRVRGTRPRRAASKKAGNPRDNPKKTEPKKKPRASKKPRNPRSKDLKTMNGDESKNRRNVAHRRRTRTGAKVDNIPMECHPGGGFTEVGGQSGA